jgi:excisionase family DNA binding protein
MIPDSFTTISYKFGQDRNGGAMADSEFLTLTAAAKLLAFSRWALYRRIDEGALIVYKSIANRRVRLVKRADVERLLEPIPATPVARQEGNVNG